MHEQERVNFSLRHELPSSMLVMSNIAPPAERQAGSITAPPFSLPESLPMQTSPAIQAAERCIVHLERGSVVSTTDLQVMLSEIGEPCEVLWHRVRIGWFPTGSVEQAIAILRDYIHDRRMELPR